jgi:acetyl/propionyl-CoA carboxylase alpha subunit
MSKARYTIVGGKSGGAKDLEVYDLAASATERDTWDVAIDGAAPRGVSVRHLGDDKLHILLDGRSHDVTYRIDGNRVHCVLRGHRFAFDVYDERALRRLRQEQAAGGTVRPEIKSPMAGKIIAVPAKQGDTLAIGDPLVVIEAMKMENLIRAPHAGVVEQIDVAPGDAVENGARLLVLRPLESEEAN